MKMKLSEVMRRGSKMAKQVFGGWTSPDGDGGCALMLASVGAGFCSAKSVGFRLAHGFAPIPHRLLFTFPELYVEIEPPCGCDYKESAWHVIMHLNDRHQWTAERIAGWIEAHIESPTYSALDIQHYMESADKKPAGAVHE